MEEHAVYASVLNKQGVPVTTLGAADFVVREEGVNCHVGVSRHLRGTRGAADGRLLGIPGSDGAVASACAAVPLGELADIRVTTGPPMIKNENGVLVGYDATTAFASSTQPPRSRSVGSMSANTVVKMVRR